MKAILSYLGLASIITSVALLNYLSFTCDKLITEVIVTDVVFGFSFFFALYLGVQTAIKQAKERERKREALDRLRLIVD